MKRGLQQKAGFVTVREMAKMLGYSEQYMYRLARDGKIPNYRVSNGRILFNLEEVNEWLEGKRRGEDRGGNYEA